jgi:hypothetical protein
MKRERLNGIMRFVRTLVVLDSVSYEFALLSALTAALTAVSDSLG